MNDLLISAAVVVAAIAAGLGLVAWRIHRLQYPPEHRWPSDRERRRRRSSRRRGPDDSGDGHSKRRRS